MSFLTSPSLSFNNLRTKKGENHSTSFAGSIGIIGIALILSLSNGVNQYIQSIEEETLSEYPLQIQSTGFDITSMMTDAHPGQKQGDDEEDKIHVSQMITKHVFKNRPNDLTSLKQYLDSGKPISRNIPIRLNTLLYSGSADLQHENGYCASGTSGYLLFLTGLWLLQQHQQHDVLHDEH